MGSRVFNSSTIIIYNSEEPLIGEAEAWPRLGGIVLDMVLLLHQFVP